ncbi:MAG: sigma-70 region 4 domain-containing protein [Bacteroidales bacterium]|nr:sigma-70 region 4 domain-containing protein [Bacteroidales bacterium]
MLSVDINLLRDYLGQYQRAKRRQGQLERRLKEICEEMSNPISGVHYSPVNTHPINEIGLGAASYALKKSEQESRIEDQQKVTARYLQSVMDMMEYLDANSDERAVLELHYIDGLKWEDVADEMHMAKSTVMDKQRAGLIMLLSVRRVRYKLRQYAASRKDDTPL